ncbi:sporulation protein YqfD [Bacillus kwashiorkori]|uniref:sporulation protein YqfD n=1 Tax=Bacillus kwashiorkori TaxID=1522318 RepID=UPI0007866A24|nr:sporulation protein YqfD [Bacillus kwashiorkori]
MKNLWVRKLAGHITVKITGNGVERFINKLIREKIVIWNVKRLDYEAVTFQMFVKDFQKLREAKRYHPVKIAFVEKAGFPYFLKRLKKNNSFVIGTVLALLTIFILSNMIWHIEINGAQPETAFKIEQLLKEKGVKKGQLQFFLDSPEQIQQYITKQLDEITWIGVELKGTTFHFQVVEKERPEPPEKTSPQHLVAKKEAIIVDLFVEKGQPLVSVNDFVRPGQILVSGMIGKEEEPNIISAKGKILGKTWYKTETEIELKTTVSVLSGEKKVFHSFNLGSINIPLYGFKKPEYKKTEVETSKKSFKFLKWTLPISYTKKTIYEKEEYVKTYSEKEAKEMAKQLAKKDLLKTLPSNAKIVNEKILHEKVDNGKLKLSVIYDVIENIVKEQPIIEN